MSKQIILLKWDSIGAALGSILYGSVIFIHPEILNTYRVYELIRDIFNAHLIGGVFVLLGITKLVGIWKNNNLLKKFSLRGLTFVWLLFLISFIITPPPNTVWTHAALVLFLIVGATIKEG